MELLAQSQNPHPDQSSSRAHFLFTVRPHLPPGREPSLTALEPQMPLFLLPYEVPIGPCRSLLQVRYKFLMPRLAGGPVCDWPGIKVFKSSSCLEFSTVQSAHVFHMSLGTWSFLGFFVSMLSSLNNVVLIQSNPNPVYFLKMDGPQRAFPAQVADMWNPQFEPERYLLGSPQKQQAR